MLAGAQQGSLCGPTLEGPSHSANRSFAPLAAVKAGLRAAFEHCNRDATGTDLSPPAGTGFTCAGTPGVTVHLRNGSERQHPA